jgi:uncharacterized protein YgbK (DUF1537 family)
MSGSCSPVNQSQIKWALAHGFKGLKISAIKLLSKNKEEALKAVFDEALQLLISRESLIIYSALGPDDTSIAETKEWLMKQGKQDTDVGRLLGPIMGRLTKALLLATGMRRLVVAGGDTSGFVTKELGIFALEFLMPVAPGGPLCLSHSANKAFDGLEIALKGGQVGKADYYMKVREGHIE